MTQIRQDSPQVPPEGPFQKKTEEGGKVATPTRLVYGPKQRDELVKATQGLLQPSPVKTLANDPLQSDRIQSPTVTVSGTDDYPFPAPGLAYYLAEAMMLGIQADSQMMQVYNSEENVFYQNIETQWDVYAKQDMSFYQQEGQKALLTGSLSVVSAAGAIGLVAYTGFKTAKFANEADALLNEKKMTTDLLSEKTLTGNLPEEEEDIGVQFGDKEESLAMRTRNVYEDFEKEKLRLTQERAEALYPSPVENEIDFEEGPSKEEKIQIQKNYEEDLGALKDKRTQQLNEIKEDRAKLIRKREDQTSDIEAQEKRRSEFSSQMSGLQAIPQLIAQVSGLGTGVIALKQQADTVLSRDTADKVKTLNQTVLQGLNRQWTTLAGYVDGMLSSYVEAIKGFSQAMQRV